MTDNFKLDPNNAALLLVLAVVVWYILTTFN